MMFWLCIVVAGNHWEKDINEAKQDDLVAVKNAKISERSSIGAGRLQANFERDAAVFRFKPVIVTWNGSIA